MASALSGTSADSARFSQYRPGIFHAHLVAVSARETDGTRSGRTLRWLNTVIRENKKGRVSLPFPPFVFRCRQLSFRKWSRDRPGHRPPARATVLLSGTDRHGPETSARASSTERGFSFRFVTRADRCQGVRRIGSSVFRRCATVSGRAAVHDRIGRAFAPGAVMQFTQSPPR